MDIFSKSFNLPFFTELKTSARSFDLSIASCICLAAFLSPPKKADAMDSLTVLSFIPILRSPINVLTRYSASIGEEEVRSSVISEIFFPTVPLPSSSGSFLRFSRTFFVVKIWLCSVDCFLCSVSFSATLPRSPIDFHSLTTFSDSVPVAFEIAFIAS